MNVAGNVKAVGIGVALLVGAYIVYKTFSAASAAAETVAKAVTAPNAFKVASQDNLVNKAFNAVTGGPGSGDQQEWTVGTKVFDGVQAIKEWLSR
jgi:hypothetical protein